MSTVPISTEVKLPAPLKKLFPHASATFFDLTEERNPLYPGSHHLYAFIQLEHPNNSVLTEANLDVAFLCTSFPLQVAGLEQVECFGVDDNLPTSYLLLYSFTKLPGDLIIQFHQSLEILCHMNVFPKCDKEQCWDRTTANCGQ